MNSGSYIKRHLLTEAYSLVSRLTLMQPFALTMPMVTAASVSPDALNLITSLLNNGHIKLTEKLNNYIEQLKSKAGSSFSPLEEQKKFVFLKLRFNDILNQLDIFADVLSQRSEHGTGVWVAGLDALAEDSLNFGSAYYEAPPIVVYLDRGHGAAIRRARTRLPGGDENPVAVIQVPRERMVGSGIASSLIHEVGHQVSELLDIIIPLKRKMAKMQQAEPDYKDVWLLFERWISEITADFWSVGNLGICGTQGLMGVVSLPEYFQFRIDPNDPHPAPFMRVLLSCVMGNSLYPHPQWKRISDMWEAFYPVSGLDKQKTELVAKMKSRMKSFVEILKSHKPSAMKGKMLYEIFPLAKRQPHVLQQMYAAWQNNPLLLKSSRPSDIFAVVGQARADGKITAKGENELLTKQLIRWAYWKAHDSCAGRKQIKQQSN